MKNAVRSYKALGNFHTLFLLYAGSAFAAVLILQL